MATTKKRKATRSLAERARDPNEQRKSALAEIAQFHARIDAALVLGGYEDAPEDARIARSFLDGAAQAIRDGDAARAFQCGVAMRELLIKLEGADSVRRGTRNDVQAVKFENLNAARNAGSAKGRRKRAATGASRKSALDKRARALRDQHGWTAKHIGEVLAYDDPRGRSPERIARIIGPSLALRRGRPRSTSGS